MTAPVDSKFSLFASAGDLIAGDIVVGLRGGVNSRFTNTGGVGTFLPLLGGTMLGAIDMGGFKITDLALCTDPADAASKEYVDSTGSGTVDSGTINQIAYYAATGTTVSGTSTIPSAVQANITAVGTIATGVWNGTLIGAAYGGTGLASPTAHGIMIGEGASAMTPIVLTTGQILIGSTGVDPVAAAINSGAGILVGNGAGSITVQLAAIADHTLLANISGGSLAPSSTTLTALIDNAIGSTQGDILYRSATAWSVLAPGTSGQLLKTGGAAANPAWTTSTFPATGGTAGNILISNGTNYIASTSLWPNTVGSAGKILRSDGTTNAYTTSTFADTYAASTLLYSNGANTVSGLATANSSALVTTSAGVPVQAGTMTDGQLIIGSTGATPVVASLSAGTNITITPGAGTISIAAVGAGVVPAALSKGDDTNVTLTLTGTPSTALLQATTITAGWTGQLSVARGGTGLASITAHDLIIGNGTSAATLLAPSATSGVPLISQGASADPAYGTAVVAGGGTGNTTFTAYSLICAGTTSTGAFQNVSGVGTSGQVLQSNGASALPTWATIPGATSAALSKGDDTNVTLTLTGAPTTALLTASTITAGWTGQLGLTRGGTAASLTASNGGIVYSTASALAILSGTATAGLALLSGASTTPAWSASPPITRVNVQVVTATGTFTPTSGAVRFQIEGVGGGGGGAGAPTATAGQFAMGAGGGYAGYFKKTYNSTEMGANASVTIGAAGAGGSAGQNAGSTGGNTTFDPAGTGATLTANGGVGGASEGVHTGTYGFGPVGGAGGTATNGDLNITGSYGGQGTGQGANASVGGYGASGIWGAGGQQGINAAGSAALGNGAGGSGGTTNNSSQVAGGTGTIGLVVVTEYISV